MWCEPKPHEKLLVVYTDGACSGNGRPDAVAGSGVYFGPDDPRNSALQLPEGAHTNQRAELFALLWALRYARKHEEKLRRFVVHSDSTYCVKAWREWLPAWIQREWQNSAGNPVANQDLWHEVAELRDVLDVQVELKWVKGHSKNSGNEAADALAVQARQTCKAAREAAANPTTDTAVNAADADAPPQAKKARKSNEPKSALPGLKAFHTAADELDAALRQSARELAKLVASVDSDPESALVALAVLRKQTVRRLESV